MSYKELEECPNVFDTGRNYTYDDQNLAFSHARDVSVVNPPLRSTLKYLHNYWMNFHVCGVIKGKNKE